MKNMNKLFGIIALVAVMVFSACGGDGGNGITDGKAAGAEVSAPTLASATHNSITVNAVASPSNGQPVEYDRNSSNTAPSTGWQDGLTFSGLSPSTTYYIFARSKENATHNAGTASAGLSVTTPGPLDGTWVLDSGGYYYTFSGSNYTSYNGDPPSGTVDKQGPFSLLENNTKIRWDNDPGDEEPIAIYSDHFMLDGTYKFNKQ